MARIKIVPKSLELGLGQVDRIEINVNYSIGDESTTLQVRYFNDSAEVTTITPKLLPVPPETMKAWGYDFGQIVHWVMDEISAELLPENPS